MSKLFVPNSFEAPRVFDSKNFHFRVLDDDIAELDFEAVMSSQNRLKGIFGVDSEWPRADMTIEENIVSLKVHKYEFESRKAFAYSVFNCSKNKCLGSVYIDPSRSPNYDCEVYLWIRNDSLDLENDLYQTAFSWLQQVWPFSKVAYPGRVISWGQWGKELTVG